MLNVDLDADEDADGDGNDANDFTALTVVAGDGDANLPKIKSAKFTAGTAAVLTFASAQEASGENPAVKALKPTAPTTVRREHTGATATPLARSPSRTVRYPRLATVGSSLPLRVPPPTWRRRVPALRLLADADDRRRRRNHLQRGRDLAEATGIPATGNAGLDDVEGSATYEGGSVGVYVKNVLDNQANVVSATSGHFSRTSH